MSNKVIEATFEEFLKNGVEKKDLVKVRDLYEYGFDEGILTGLKTFEILPDVYIIKKTPYVLKEDVLKIISTFVRNALAIYEQTEKVKTFEEDFMNDIKKHSLKLDKDDPDVKEFFSGRLTKDEFIQKKVHDKNKAIKDYNQLISQNISKIS